MGFSICYLASRLPPKEFAESLNVQITGSANDMPDGDWWVATLVKDNWTILWSEDENFGSRSRNLISEVSRRVDVVHCQVNETVMWSSSEYWSAGHAIWKVTHNGGDGDIFDLSAEGELPQQFDEIRERHTLEQQEDGEDCDHIFEIPLELARSHIGFRHEDILEEGDVTKFHIITAPQRGSFFARLLGRRS